MRSFSRLGWFAPTLVFVAACSHTPVPTSGDTASFSPNTCKRVGITAVNIAPTTQEEARKFMQGEWTMSSEWPAMFRVQEDKVIWLGNGKVYQATMNGNALVGDITDEDGVTCHLEMSGGPTVLQIKRSNCVDKRSRPATIQNSVGNFVKAQNP